MNYTGVLWTHKTQSETKEKPVQAAALVIFLDCPDSCSVRRGKRALVGTGRWEGLQLRLKQSHPMPGGDRDPGPSAGMEMS